MLELVRIAVIAGWTTLGILAIAAIVALTRFRAALAGSATDPAHEHV